VKEQANLKAELRKVREDGAAAAEKIRAEAAANERNMVSDLRAALNDPVTRDEAAEILRGPFRAAVFHVRSRVR
jgi:hypothetical protein